MQKLSRTEQRKHTHQEGHFAVELQNVSAAYVGRLALENLTLQIDPGLRVAVAGPNGAGKSTLFHVLAGVMPPSSGKVRVHGHLSSRHLCTAYVTQSRQVDWSFPVSVSDVVMMGRSGLLGLFRRPAQADRAAVAQSLERVGLAQLAERQIVQLSGGQKQRMFIARALAQEADLILLDEPLAGLDLGSQERIFVLLDELKDDGVTVLFATHDLDLAAKRFDRILLLNREIIAYGRQKTVLTTQNLSAAYGGHVQMVDTPEGRIIVGDTGGHHAHDEEGPHG